MQQARLAWSTLNPHVNWQVLWSNMAYPAHHPYSCSCQCVLWSGLACPVLRPGSNICQWVVPSTWAWSFLSSGFQASQKEVQPSRGVLQVPLSSLFSAPDLICVHVCCGPAWHDWPPLLASLAGTVSYPNWSHPLQFSSLVLQPNAACPTPRPSCHMNWWVLQPSLSCPTPWHLSVPAVAGA